MMEHMQQMIQKMMSGMMKPEDMPAMMQTMMEQHVQGNDSRRSYRVHAKHDAALHVDDVFRARP